MKIIIYDDNPGFGGHQVQAVHAVGALASTSSIETVFILDPANEMLAENVARIKSCRMMESPRATCHPQIPMHLGNRPETEKLATLFKTFGADLILCIQGNIEQSALAIPAAQRAGIECISYIALPHRMAAIGAKMGVLRDLLASRYLLNAPTRYITISEGMADLLRERGAHQSISVVPNGIEMPPSPQPVRDKNPRVLGMLGRIEFKQKRHDLMLKAFSEFPVAFSDCRLIIAGDGPDRDRLEQLTARSSRKNDILLQPWQHDISTFFSTIDMLVIPSRYEGVPLVMLEALARGVPVIGSNRDGMPDILPADWTFETGNAEALANTFSRVRKTWKNDIGAVQQRILSEHSMEAFKANFVNAVLI